MHHNPDQERLTSDLTGYIDEGISLLLASKGLEASKHFEYSQDRVDGVSVRGGMTFPVTCILNERELVYAASTVARYSGSNGLTAEIAGCHTGDFSYDLTDESRYDPSLTARFYQEAGTVAAEEWLHILQHVTDVPLAGQEDVEVDVAAYLHSRGVYLSADYLTRYAARYNWLIGIDPERQKELIDFSMEFGRRVLSHS